MSEIQTTSFEFRTEIQQLLDILIHSLYKEREIFLRELVSNAADALGRLQFEMLTNREVLEPDAALEIHIDFDEEAKTITVADSGIGMTRDELVENLGTIAYSGAKAFLKALEEDQRASVDQIGQFGVGFYSAFMVASEITVISRSYRPDAEVYAWKSDGTNRFTIEPSEREHRGTSVILKLKEDAAEEFLKAYRLENIVKRYSDFVPFPIYVGEMVANQKTALWRQPPGEVTDEQYEEFYRHLTYDFQPPTLHAHLSVDTPIQIFSILYVPSRRDYSLLTARTDHGLRLYSRKILIQEHNKDLLPNYLRFVEGVVDSDDLPLNVSREVVQTNRVLNTVKRNLVRKITGALEEMAKDKPDDYRTFWAEFGPFIKEGISTEPGDRERLVDLLRFHSSRAEGDVLISLREYVGRMVEGQEDIYYAFGEDLASIRVSPHLDAFKARDIQVLFLTEPIDSFTIMGLPDYEGKKLRNVDDASLELPGQEAEKEELPHDKVQDEAFSTLLERFRNVLGDKVTEVREAKLLVDSPCRLVNPANVPGSEMHRVYRLLNEEYQVPKKIMEVNPRHSLVAGISNLVQTAPQDPLIDQCIEQLYENALLVEGIHPNPAGMIGRIQALMEAATGKPTGRE
ncbi:MAG: molecular chaperone HtpG [Anaerolineae bacterium]|nr:molecular chaperone HtpG [Anaerolineae bacterium]